MRADTDWFRDARWGIFVHFLAAPASSTEADVSAEEWNRRVGAFDVRRFAAQADEAGAGYAVITLGQNTGHYCSPNAAYDAIVGRRPSLLSERDLVADLSEALAARGIPLLAYVPCHAPGADRRALEAFACTPPWDDAARSWSVRPGYRIVPEADERLTVFQRRWEAVLREWSLRWVARVRGWWVDGVYYADRMYRFPDEPNFASFAAAVKAGNPRSIVAFNGGVHIPVISLTEHEDYTAGELNRAFPTDIIRPPKFRPVQRWVDGAQYHVLTFMGGWWGQGPPRMGAEFVIGATKDIVAREGVISWDVPVDERGTIPPPFMERLRALGAAVRSVRAT